MDTETPISDTPITDALERRLALVERDRAEALAVLESATEALEYAANKLNVQAINGHKVLAARLAEARAFLATVLQS